MTVTSRWQLLPIYKVLGDNNIKCSNTCAIPHLHVPYIPPFGQTTIPAVNRWDELIIGEDEKSKMENREGETKTEEEERKIDEE